MTTMLDTHFLKAIITNATGAASGSVSPIADLSFKAGYKYVVEKMEDKNKTRTDQRIEAKTLTTLHLSDLMCHTQLDSLVSFNVSILYNKNLSGLSMGFLPVCTVECADTWRLCCCYRALINTDKHIVAAG
jgi:hypothetical protein